MTEQRLDNGARLIDFGRWEAGERRLARGANFSVEWVPPRTAISFQSAHEAIVLFTAGGTVGKGHRAVPPGSVAITPAGEHRLMASAQGPVIVLATERGDVGPNETQRSDRVAPLGPPHRRLRPLLEPEIRSLAAIAHPADNPRLKFLQSETLSINLVLYDGPRGRSSLSPHAHTDFEQGSLAIEGDYLHHLRIPWGSDAGAWREDAHIQAADGTLLIIPPGVIHTTEGVGAGRHWLIDIFAPPRPDFIARGWVANAADYQS